MRNQQRNGESKNTGVPTTSKKYSFFFCLHKIILYFLIYNNHKMQMTNVYLFNCFIIHICIYLIMGFCWRLIGSMRGLIITQFFLLLIIQKTVIVQTKTHHYSENRRQRRSALAGLLQFVNLGKLLRGSGGEYSSVKSKGNNKSMAFQGVISMQLEKKLNFF